MFYFEKRAEVVKMKYSYVKWLLCLACGKLFFRLGTRFFLFRVVFKVKNREYLNRFLFVCGTFFDSF